MRIAIVHDYLREYGGAERVVEALHAIWPDAPLYTSFVDWNTMGDHATRFDGWDIRTSWVQHNWLMRKFHSPLRFLAPFVWKSFDLSSYDVVITSSGWFICRGVRAGHGGGKKDRSRPYQVCYIHHPPRNLYGYATGRTYQKYPLVRAYATVINFFMRQYDYHTAQTVDTFLSNSEETARRVRKFYRRESTVVYPPIRTSAIKASRRSTGSYYLSVGRLVWAKQTELIIRVANEKKLPLKIVGTGPEQARLRALAGPTVEFMGSVSDEALAGLYRGAKATIYCALEEDFGIVPVESMAQGTPVIALGQGGVAETVLDTKTGVVFTEATGAALRAAIDRFETLSWPVLSRASVVRSKIFSAESFAQHLRRAVSSVARV